MENHVGLTVRELSEGLEMDRSNLNKLIKKLKLEPNYIRGKLNQWSRIFSDEQIDLILDSRKGIPHKIKKNAKGFYEVQDA